MNDPLRIGVLGATHPHFAGRKGCIERDPNLTLTALCDPDPDACQALAQQCRVPAYADPRDLLVKAPVDLVLIESTNRLNGEFAEQAARAGKGILLEKPGARNLADLRRLANVVEETGAFCHVGYHLRYAPSVRLAYDMVQRGLLGKITTGRFHCACMKPWLTDPWFCDTEDMGGLVFLDFCHMLDLLMLFLGEPDEGHAMIRKLDDVPAHPFEDSATFQLRFGDTLIAGDCCGWEANDWITTWDVELYGTEGTLRFGIHPPWVKLYLTEARDGYQKGWNTFERPNYDGEENYAEELRDVRDRFLRDRDPGGADVFQAVRVVEWIERFYAQQQEAAV